MSSNKNPKFYISNVTGDKVNITGDSSVINSNYTVINQSQNEQQQLKEALIDFIKAVQQEPHLNPLEKSNFTEKAETILEDLEENHISKKRLSRFHEMLSNITPEMQLTSTIASSISAVKDAIELFS